jgi:hypothetical protein
MGYTRQATAIGFLMCGFSYLLNGRVFAYLLIVLLAGMIHKTAFVFAPLAFLRPGVGKLRSLLGFSLLIGMLGGAYLIEQADTFVRNYVTNTMESGGGQIRTLMNLPPSLIIFLYWKKWGKLFNDRWLWGIFALIAISILPLVSVASTAVDRMALYLIPLQIVVWSRLPMLAEGTIQRNSVIVLLILYHATVQFIWLNFGTHAYCWVPYNNLLIPTK